MLSDDTRGPLDLDSALEVAEAAGEDAVIALLQQTLTDPGLRGDPRMASTPRLATHTAGRTMYRAHEDYRRESERTLRAVSAAHPDASAYVVPLDVNGLLAYAEREGKDPASRQTRLDYNHSLDGAGRDLPWPPPRNSPCWCGSARKYKKCCGAPGFLNTVPPDPASLVLKIGLDDVEPPVWRRIAAPSNTPLDELHQMIQTAMGWRDTHLDSSDGPAPSTRRTPGNGCCSSTHVGILAGRG
jgi:hypothetical protein